MDLRWTGTTFEAKLWDLSRAGLLEGVGGLKQGLGLAFVPYGLGYRSQTYVPPEPHSFLAGRAGFDVSWNATSGVGGVLTVNTDFAETEVDTRQINLTRFPLFFPEKRSFFLESSNLFTFGLGLQEQFIPFYSRRVGILEGQPVPIDAGVKVMARSGNWSLAALDVGMRDTAVSGRTNLFAGRLTFDVDENLRLGIIGTSGEPTGALSNFLTGVDAVWQTSKFLGGQNLAFGLWGAVSGGESTSGKRTGWGFKADYPNDLWDLSFKVNEFGDALKPSLGFLPRPGTRRWSTGIAYQPRPGPGSFSWVRQFFFEAAPTVVTRLDGTVESWDVFLAPVNFVTTSGERFEVNVDPQYELLTAPFEVSPGVIIQPGSYRFARARLEFRTSKSRPLWAELEISNGTFYDGRIRDARVIVGWSEPSGHLMLSSDFTYVDGSLPAGRFIQRLGQFRFVYAFDPSLVFSAYVQYDSESRNLGTYARLRWTIRPGCEAFLVWNRGWTSPPGAPLSQLAPEADQIVAKLRWTFRW
jgi:hypothetical protein